MTIEIQLLNNPVLMFSLAFLVLVNVFVIIRWIVKSLPF